MKKTSFGLLFLLALVVADANAQAAVTTFILVRHAEKGNDGTDDPDLKPEGHERAKRLAALLKNTSIDAVYSTRYKRTRNTVTPLALEKELDVQVYDAVKPEILDALINKHHNKTILIAGHSNTIPQIANLLIGREEYKTFPDAEYNNIFIISFVERGKGTSVTVLNY